jgi:acyl carrier protein
MDVREEIQKYIAENLLFAPGSIPLDDHTSFLNEGIIDSVGVMDLVLFVEERFNLQVPDSDVTRENFDSVASLVRYIETRSLMN